MCRMKMPTHRKCYIIFKLSLQHFSSSTTMLRAFFKLQCACERDRQIDRIYNKNCNKIPLFSGFVFFFRMHAATIKLCSLQFLPAKLSWHIFGCNFFVSCAKVRFSLFVGFVRLRSFFAFLYFYVFFPTLSYMFVWV